MIVRHPIEIDFVKNGVSPQINTVQGDSNARVLVISLYESGNAWLMPEEASALLRFCKPDGTGGVYDTLPDGTQAWSAVNNVLQFVLAPQVLAVPGLVQAQLEIVKGDELVSSFTFHILVDRDPSIGTVPSEDYINWSAWTQSELNRMLAEAKESGEFDGPKGDTGRGIVATVGNADGSWTFAYTDGTSETVSSDAYNALVARMNTFTALEEGSTTGDAELADIRVGYDGTTYDTSGEAVRGQVRQLSGEIDDIQSEMVFKTQFIDKDKIISGYWTNTDQQYKTVENDYHCLDEKISLEAGTYYYENLDRTFSTVKYPDGTIKKFSEIGATWNSSGSITLEYDSVVAITVNLATTDYSTVRLCNCDDYPEEYFYGVYEVKIPKLKIPVSSYTNLMIVDADGKGDYTDIQSAIDECNDTADHPVTIFVNPGTYERFTMVTDDVRVRHINIIGLSEKLCIVQSNTGDYYEPAGEINTNGTIENLTFISTYGDGTQVVENDDCYAVHLDYRGAKEEFFRNCTFISYCASAVGIGLHCNERIIFDNCKFYSYGHDDVWGTKGLGAFFFHNNNTDNTGAELIINNCEMYNANGPKCLLGTNSFPDVTTYPTIQVSKTLFVGTEGYSAIIPAVFQKKNIYGNCADITES